MKLEAGLHSLTSDITFMAERMNPYMVGIASGLSTKLIATTGQSLFSFCNGLHADTGDRISDKMKSALFVDVPEEWKLMLAFKHVSFPTTCGYQHVWKDSNEAKKYLVHHYFMEPGLGLAISLEDSICHHFMGGAFDHCTSVCVLESKNEEEEEDGDIVTIRNDDDFFSIFAWGSSANSRTARGNNGRQNSLANHRLRQQLNRSQAEQQNRLRSPVEGAIAPTAGDADPNAPTPGVAVAASAVPPVQDPCLHSGDPAMNESPMPVGVPVPLNIPPSEEEADLSSDESPGFRYEDDEYESDEPMEKKIRLE
jgi:hypothetical protein